MTYGWWICSIICWQSTAFKCKITTLACMCNKLTRPCFCLFCLFLADGCSTSTYLLCANKFTSQIHHGKAQLCSFMLDARCNAIAQPALTTRGHSFNIYERHPGQCQHTSYTTSHIIETESCFSKNTKDIFQGKWNKVAWTQVELSLENKWRKFLNQYLCNFPLCA